MYRDRHGYVGILLLTKYKDTIFFFDIWKISYINVKMEIFLTRVLWNYSSDYYDFFFFFLILEGAMKGVLCIHLVR